MDNIAYVTEITRNNPNVIIGRIEKNKRYRLSFLAVGEAFTIRFWLKDETDATKSTVINRMCDVTDGVYTYTFEAPQDAVITYHINGGKIQGITLIAY